MSNYTVLTNYAAKDALISGNPLKLIKGADFTADFTAIASAVATKIDGAVVFGPDGNATQPSYGFTNNAGTGMFNAAGVLGFASAGVLRVSISASGNVVLAAPVSGRTLDITGVSTSAIVSRFIANGATGGYVDTFDGANTLVRGFLGYGAAAFTGAAITDFGVASVTGTLRLSANNGSTTHLSITSAGGLFTTGASGGDQGAGTINATGHYTNGVSITPIVKFKPAATTRTSTAALATDPDLTTALTSGKTYAVRVFVDITSATAGGIQAGLTYSGTVTNANQAGFGLMNTTFTGGSASSGSGAMGAATVALNAGTTAVGNWIVIEASLTTSSSGTLALNWAQNSSNATGTTLAQTSYMVVTPLN